jgi:ParB/RepB/Spo0J family partition protein
VKAVKNVTEELPVRLLDPGANVRFDVGNVDELAESIKELGIVVPLVVRPVGKRYEIVAGHRRFAAAKQAGLRKVPATVREISDRDIVAFMVAENVQRKRLNPIEIGHALKRMRDADDLSQDRIAEKVGKSQYWVSTHLRATELPQRIQDKIRRKELTLTAALGYDAPKNPRGERMIDPTRGAAPPPIAGLVYVIVGIYVGGHVLPDVEVVLSRDDAIERRDEWVASETYRKVIVRPCEVSPSERVEGAA